MVFGVWGFGVFCLFVFLGVFFCLFVYISLEVGSTCMGVCRKYEPPGGTQVGHRRWEGWPEHSLCHNNISFSGLQLLGCGYVRSHIR